MDPSINDREENRRLRRTMRDLVALSTLPAVWMSLDPNGIMRSLADVLISTLSLDFVYARLADPSGKVIEVCRRRGPAPADVQKVQAALAPLLKSDQTSPAATIQDPFGSAALRVAVARFGVGDDSGLVVAGSCNPDFPTEQDRLLLGVGANQTAIVLHRRRSGEEVQEQREWLRVMLRSIGDAVIATDTQGRITFLNSVAEELTSWTSSDAQGQQLQTVFNIVNEQTRRAAENPVERVLREGVVVGLGNHTILIARDGTERPIDDSAAPIRDAFGKMLGVVLIFRDVTEQRRTEQQRNVRLAVTQALSEASTVEDGVSRVLRAVCENLGWDLGLFWTVSDSGDSLECASIWHLPDQPMDEFEKASYARIFKSGEGLPGRAWTSGKSAWIFDINRDSNFPRLNAAVDCGLHSALAHPVAVGDRTLGVFEFFNKRFRSADPSLVEMMATVAGSLGQFMERKAAEDELRRSEQELADFFDSATIGLHWVGPDGTILRANQAELDVVGYGREEYVGRPITKFHADGDVICDILQRLQSGEKLKEYPARLRCKDGSIKDVLIDSSVLWRDGKFVHTRCFTRDVTERKQAEAKAREQEQRTRAILESITDAFCALDRDWRFTYINRQAEILLRRSREDLLGRDHWREYPDTLGTEVERCYRRAIEENVTVAFEHFYPPHERWYEVHAYPSPDGLSVYFRDVSERKRSELAVRESEQRFRQLADAMPQIVWTAGPDGNIDYLNRRWAEFSGILETVGNDGWGPLLHPEDAATAGKRWADSVATGAPFEMELRLLDRQRGTYRWHLIRTVAVPDESGRVARWYGTSTDIHEQKRAEERARYLAEASAALAGVVDYESTLQKVANLAVPYFADWSAVDVVDGGGLRRLAVSHQDPQKIQIAHELARLYPPDMQASGGIAAVLRTGKPEILSEITDELLVRGAKGERHLRLIRSLGLRSYICVPLVISGSTAGVLTFATAESDRRYVEADLALAIDLANRAAVAVENTRLYQALREADRRKDEFLATLAHELRNPLAPVRNALEVLKRVNGDAALAEDFRSMMERQVTHMSRLIDDLMDVSRITRGKLALRREITDLSAVIRHAGETCTSTYAERHHDVRITLPPEPLLMDGDPVRLEQIIGNLLNNACKYTNPGGVIEIRATRERNDLVVSVKDNGIGIAPDMLPRVFEMFTQANRAAERTGGGLGIGLSLVKGLVELHGGSIRAKSDGEGGGSEFVVRLPALVQPSSAEEPPVPVGIRPPTAGKGRRILVVDDNMDAAKSLSLLLKLQGNETQMAADGEEAVQRVASFRPDLVLLDIGLPKLDGYDACRAIRKLQTGNQPIVIALTGWGQEEDRRRSREAGFDSHLVKPVDYQALMTMIESILPATEAEI